MNDEIERIAIFGANGSIGRALCAHYEKQSNVYAFTRDDFDINESGIDKILLDDYEVETFFLSVFRILYKWISLCLV